MWSSHWSILSQIYGLEVCHELLVWKNLMDCSSGRISWTTRLEESHGLLVWKNLVDYSSGRISWTTRLEESRGLLVWKNLVDYSSGRISWTTRLEESRGLLVWKNLMDMRAGELCWLAFCMYKHFVTYHVNFILIDYFLLIHVFYNQYCWHFLYSTHTCACNVFYTVNVIYFIQLPL